MAAYFGLVSFALFWPAAQLLAANESFQVIGGWSLIATALFVLAFLLVPWLTVAAVDRSLARLSLSAVWVFRRAVAGGVAAIFWSQLTYQELSGLLNAFGETPLKQIVILGGALALVVVAIAAAQPIYRWAWVLSAFAAFSALALATVPVNAIPPGTERASEGGGGATQGPVVLLVLDGLSTMPLLDGDQIDARRFPTFARMSREWTWFRRASTNATSTLLAQPMLFSGRYAGSRDSLPGGSDHLFARLGTSYDVKAYMPGQGLCNAATELCLDDPSREGGLALAAALNRAVFATWFEISVPTRIRQLPLAPMHAVQSWRFDWRGPTPPADPRARDRLYAELFIAQYERFLAAAELAHRGSLLVHWSMLTHYPFVMDATGEITFPQPGEFTATLSTAERAQAIENYRAQAAYADSLLGAFIATMERAGTYADATIVVTSDHGTSYVGDNYVLDPEVYRIPLFVKARGLRPGVDDRIAQTVDIAPTIAAAAGIEGAAFDGHSLLGPPRSAARVIYKLGRSGVWIQRGDGEWLQYADLREAGIRPP